MKLDIGWLDLAAGLGLCLSRRRRRYEDVESIWSDEAKATAFAHLSVRSGFDLLLETLGWPPESEIIVTAVTIPHMVEIIRERGLVPVPVDIDPDTMGVDPAAVEALITPRTRAVLVAHLFGGRLDLDGVAAVVQRHELCLLEDCAQAYGGGAYRGDPRALVSMFSFGTIKTATALGGALFTIRRTPLLAAMRSARDRLPGYANGYFAKKVLRVAALLLVANRVVYPVFVWLFTLAGRDYDAFINASVRGFSGPGFFERIRRQPPPALIGLLSWRLRRIKPNHCHRRAAMGAHLARGLPPELRLLGHKALNHTHWLIPVECPDPDAVVGHLRAHGFDATQGCSSLMAVEAPPGFPPPRAAKAAFEKLVYFPIYGPAGVPAMARMVQALNASRVPGTEPIRSTSE